MKYVDFTVNLSMIILIVDMYSWSDMMCTKDIKIVYVMSDYCIGKRQYSYHGVDHISFHCKEYHSIHLQLV